MAELKMKKCKECGKMFMPTSNKQQYCTEVHYRPCPVCGKPVLAKYLSDPARCCCGVCKSKLGKMNKEGTKPSAIELSKEEVNYVKADVESTVELAKSIYTVNPADVKKYVGGDANGFETNKLYEVSYVSAGKGKHQMVSNYNVTDNTEVHLVYEFSNKKHISQYFKAAKINTSL